MQEDDIYYTGMGDKADERTEWVVCHWGCLWGLNVQTGIFVAQAGGLK